MDDCNAGRERLRRAREADGLPVEPDTTGIGRVNASENPAERALAGAVLAAERVAAARRISTLTSSSATTPGKRLVMPSKLTAGMAVRPAKAGPSDGPVRPAKAGPSGGPVRPAKAGPSGGPTWEPLKPSTLNPSAFACGFGATSEP